MKTVSLPHVRMKEETTESDSEFAFASTLLTYEHATEQWTVSGLVRIQEETIDTEEELHCRFGVSEKEWSEYVVKVGSFFSTATPARSCHRRSSLTSDILVPDLSQSDYKLAIDSARQSIIAGDAYELCITTQFRSTVPDTIASDPYLLYRSLRTTNPAPYSAYFHLPLSSLAILSSSPERYMRIDQSGEVEMKPIKGTVRRSSDPIENERRKKALEADEKERAENLMIVDLCRNDLIAFCEVESVCVPRLMVVETYQTVHQFRLFSNLPLTWYTSLTSVVVNSDL